MNFKFLKSPKFWTNVTMFLLTGVVTLGDPAVTESAIAIAQTRVYIDGVMGIIKAGLFVSGGGIGLFGCFQLIMAYLQSNPTEYAAAVKKIVAGGMLGGLAVIAATFIKTAA